MGRREVSASPFTVCFQEASVAPLQCACRRLWFHLYSQPSESSGCTLYSALPESFGFTSTVNLHSGSLGFTFTVRSFGFTSTVAARKPWLYLLRCTSRKFRRHLYSKPSGNLGFTFYGPVSGNFGFTSTVRLQGASASRVQ